MTSTSTIRVSKTKKTDIEFEVDVTGASSKKMEVRLVMESVVDGYNIMVSAIHKSGDTWQLTIPALKMMSKKSDPTFKLEVVVDGYHFVPTTGKIVLGEVPSASVDLKEGIHMGTAGGTGRDPADSIVNPAHLRPEFPVEYTSNKQVATNDQDDDPEEANRETMEKIASDVQTGQARDIAGFDPKQVARDAISRMLPILKAKTPEEREAIKTKLEKQEQFSKNVRKKLGL